MERKPQPVAPVIKQPLPVVVEDTRVPKADPSLSKRLEDTKVTEKVNLSQIFIKKV